MPEPALSISTLRPAWSVARRLLPWVLRHPFVVSPVAWSLALAGWIAAAGAVVLADAGSPYMVTILTLVLAGIIGGLWGWRRLASPSDLPIVFLAPFKPATAGASEASVLHAEALRARLAEGPLAAHLTVRMVPAPVSQRDAGRLLEVTGGSAVVFGRVKSIGTKATWEAELLARWPSDEHPRFHLVPGPDTVVVEKYDRRVQLPPRHELVIELRAPVERLIDERFDSTHSDRVEGTLLALAAAQHAGSDGEKAQMCVKEADHLRASLSERTRASLEITRTELSEFTDIRAVLAALESAAREDASHIDLWNFLVFIAYLGKLSGDVTDKDFLGYAKQAVAIDPEDALAHYNLGEALMNAGRLEEALAEFDRSAAHPEYADRRYLHVGRGITSYNLGRFDTAREAYERVVRLQPTARAHLYLGDTYRALGQPAEARHNYVTALRIQPDLVDAHRGYWYEAQEQDFARASSTFDRDFHLLLALPGFGGRRWRRPIARWLLRRQFRQHPEDSRIHYMLGAHALIGGDLGTAEERLKFALELIDHDYEALARLAVVYALQERRGEAAAVLDQLWQAPSLEGPGLDDGQRRAIAGSFVVPFLEEPRLATSHGGEWILERFFARFGPVTGEPAAFLMSVASGRVPTLSCGSS